jgi:hypothetical protein
MIYLVNMISMILFGAGSSIPFGIPGMAGFTEQCARARDPVIGSIFEEVIAERIRDGHLAPLSENLESRKAEGAK